MLTEHEKVLGKIFPLKFQMFEESLIFFPKQKPTLREFYPISYCTNAAIEKKRDRERN